MLSSLRVAFEYMLQQFDPEVLQAQFARQAGRGSVLGIGGKPKLWEAYVARYGELAADRDFAFRRLFGEEFGKAYEQNLEQRLLAKKNVKISRSSAVFHTSWPPCCWARAPPPLRLPQPWTSRCAYRGAGRESNRNGRASPVSCGCLRCATPKFQNAEFDDDLRADTTLAASLIAREERMVQPRRRLPLASRSIRDAPSRRRGRAAIFAAPAGAPA
jgi:hypothetical protein